MEKEQKTICVIGGGAAGFYGAISCAEQIPDAQVIILEQNQTVLNKVKISGGGRCNVTHACFDPKELVGYYPRGSKELLGPFHKFQPGDTFEWFENRGVELKIEKDNRVFPVTDSSATIVDCLVSTAKAAGVKIWSSTKVMQIESLKDEKWKLTTAQGKHIYADRLLLATGSSPVVWEMLSRFHEIIDPVPSLFTFNIQHFILKDLPGISVPHASIKVEGQKLTTEGPLLITHWGLSGPAVLKMSAWGARLFNAANYRFQIQVNWTGLSEDEVERALQEQIIHSGKKVIFNTALFQIPQRLWKRLLEYLKIDELTTWSQVDAHLLHHIKQILCRCIFKVNGKSTFKEEFVTAGGVALEEVDFRTMESKKVKNLFFAGEVLDIDALTGGFNFQAAWTTSYLAASGIVKSFQNI